MGVNRWAYACACGHVCTHDQSHPKHARVLEAQPRLQCGCFRSSSDTLQRRERGTEMSTVLHQIPYCSEQVRHTSYSTQYRQPSSHLDLERPLCTHLAQHDRQRTDSTSEFSFSKNCAQHSPPTLHQASVAGIEYFLPSSHSPSNIAT